jgi:hypothetical protein
MGVHTAKSLKSIKNHKIFPYKNLKKYVFACIFGCTNLFIKVMRIKLTSQNTKNLFYFWLVSRIMNLYVRYNFDII